MPKNIVFCGHCASEKGWKRPVVRVSSKPCDICGGFDAIRERRVHPVTGKERIKTIKLNNFEHRADMLPGTPEEMKLSANPVMGQ